MVELQMDQEDGLNNVFGDLEKQELQLKLWSNLNLEGIWVKRMYFNQQYNILGRQDSLKSNTMKIKD